MIGSISPVVYGVRNLGKWLVAMALYAMGAVFAGGCLGWALGWLGSLAALPESVVAWVLLAIALAYAVHELEIAALPRPQQHWQVPAGWRARFHPCLCSTLYGMLLGVGVLTHIEVSTFYLVVVGALVIGDPLLSASIFAVYGAAHAATLTRVMWPIADWDHAYRIGTGILRHRDHVHYVNGVALVAIAGALAVTLAR